MENTIRIYNYVDSEKFELLYEGITNLIRESDYDREDNFEELLELINLLLIKNDVVLPENLDGVLYIHKEKMLRIVNLDGSLLIEDLEYENLRCFMNWCCEIDSNNNKEKSLVGIISKCKQTDDKKESLQSAIKILESIDKLELTYAVHILTTELEHDYIKRIKEL